MFQTRFFFFFFEQLLFRTGSIRGPLLFNIFLWDLFLIMKETSFASYADNNTPYVTTENLDEVITSLEKDSFKLFQWFSDNQMKANTINIIFWSVVKIMWLWMLVGLKWKLLNAKNYSELKSIADWSLKTI